ncbi:MAG: GIY-YIG nuclease family protein [Bacteroidota bacterium]
MRDVGTYWAYMLTNHSGTLYIGVTNDLARRAAQHQASEPNTFTGRYQMGRLIYPEAYPSASDAIRREKQLKGWRRTKKVALVNAVNPTWADLRRPRAGDTTGSPARGFETGFNRA